MTTANVNCRVGPATSQTSLGVVPRGTTLTVRGAVQNGWVPVVCFGQDGWISAGYVPTVTPSATPSPTASATATTNPSAGNARMQANANCRIGPGNTFTSLGVVGRNVTVQVRGAAQNGWTPVICFGQPGWIFSNYLALLGTSTPTRTATVAPPTNTPTVTPSPSLTRTATNTATASNTATTTPTLVPLVGTAFLQANVNCRTGPGTSFSSLGVVNRNARIPLRGGLQNGWYPVVCFGQDGWILGGYIAVQSPTPTRTATATFPSGGSVVTTARVNCRTGADTTSTIIVVVANGTTLTLRGATQGEWTPVVCGSQNGWISSRYLRI